MALEDTTRPRDLTCRQVTEFLGDYLSDGLTGTERASFEEHLAACPDCVSYLRQYAATMRLAKEACDGDALDSGVPEELVEAILDARRAGHRARSRRGE